MNYRDVTIARSLKIEGWMSESELGWIYDCAHSLPAMGKWVEVGVYAGRSFLTVLSALPKTASGYAVDNFSGVAGSLKGFDLRATFISNLNRIGLKNFCLLFDDSVAVAKTMPLASFDVVFIDAGHGKESVRADVLAWMPVLKPGGLLCGHDRSDRGVKQVLQEILLDYQKEVGDLWSYVVK